MQNMMLGGRIAERMHVANPQALGPEDVDLNSILAQMQSSSTARGQADPCPLLRALKPQIRVDQSIWEDLVGTSPTRLSAILGQKASTAGTAAAPSKWLAEDDVSPNEAKAE